MKIKNEGTDRELPEDGTYPFVCIQVVDLGTQKSEKYEDQRKASFAFQLVDEQTSAGEAVVVYRKFPLKVGPKSHLGQALKSWLGVEVPRGAEFDFDEVLGASGMLTIQQTEPDSAGKVYANIVSLVKAPKGMKIKKATEPIFSLWLDEQEFDQDVFDGLPEFVQEQIKESDEYKAVQEAQASHRKQVSKSTPSSKKKGK